MATNDNINSNTTSYTTTKDTNVCPSRLTIFRKRLCEKIIEWHEHEHEHEHEHNGSVNNNNIPPTSTISPNAPMPITIEEALDPIIHDALVMTGLSGVSKDDYDDDDHDETIEEDDVTPLMVACCDKDHDVNLSCLLYFVTLYSKKECYKNQDVYIQILNELLGDCLCCNRIDGNNQAIHYAASSCLPPQMALEYLAQIYIHQRCRHDDGDGDGHGHHVSMQQACFVLLSQVNNHGDTPFMMAAANGKRLSIEYWICPLMLQQDVSSSGEGGGGGGGVKKQDIMNLLMANNHSNDTVLSLAYGYGHYDIVKFLILEKSHENENYHYCYDDDDNKDNNNNNNNNNNNIKKFKSIQQRLKIEEKLAALISANPVATTTDSNLLEGTWELAFATENAVEILDEARFVYSRKKQVSSAAGSGSEGRKQVVLDEMNGGGGGGDDVGNGWNLANANQGGKLENPLHTVKRSIYLEDLDQDEDPFMVDSVSLFRGLWTVKRFYKIIGLTRTNLELVPWKKIISFCGREISATTVEKENGITMNVQFIYLDSDICISMTAGNANNLQVYTKNEEWIESRRQKKHIIQTTLAWLNGFGTPLKLRKKILSIMGHGGKDIDDYRDNVRRGMEDGQLGKLSEEEYQILLRIVYDDRVSKLTALRLGDYGDDSKDDDSAWGGKDDPFVHLTADERQSIMKQMSIGEIKKAGYIQRKFAEKNKRRRSRMQPFKRPLYEDGQGSATKSPYYRKFDNPSAP